MSTIKLLPGMMSPIDFVVALSAARIQGVGDWSDGRAQAENQATVVDARDAQWAAEIERIREGEKRMLAKISDLHREQVARDDKIERLTELCAVIQAREIEWCSTAQTASRAATGAEAKIEDLRFALREVRSVLRTCQYDPGSAAPRTRSISNRRDGVLCDCQTCGPAATLDAALAGGSR
jgi:hypothetical protein